MGRFRVILAIACSIAAVPSFGQSVPVGALAQDGPPTPEQIALVLPVTGALPDSATATVRYRLASSSNWIDGHPLFRVRPSYSNTPGVGSVSDDFAWTILGLEPGRSYDVEVTVTNGGDSVIRNATFSTRALPPAAGAPNKTVASGASGNQVQSTFDGLQPGDVLEFENGQYNVNELLVTRSGTRDEPIYIRGQSRENVVLRSSSNLILRIFEADHIIVENLTIQGDNTDGLLQTLQTGIYGGGEGQGSIRNTIRNVTVTGVDRGIVFFDEISEGLVYNNTLVGSNLWNNTFLGNDNNRTWDDDGINLPGYGNVAFNNSVTGFGDSFAFAQHVGGGNLTETRSVHYYRNEIRNSLDDMVEVDHAARNVSFYDNRSHNSANCGSLDPLYGGPYVYARNICINPARVHLHKWNDNNTGQFLYNNTFVGTVTASGFDQDGSGWYQPFNGNQEAYGYRNNIFVYRGNGRSLFHLESGGHNVIDWTHNSWFPNREIQWGGLFSDLANAQQNISNTTPVFSGTNRRMENDNITVSNPWTDQVTLGPNSNTEVTSSYVPRLAAGTSPKNSGVVIPNITDGFSGAAPDRGAVVSGRPTPAWGDQNSAPLPPAVAPNAPSDLIAN